MDRWLRLSFYHWKCLPLQWENRSGIASGEVEVYTFTCPFNIGAVSHLIIQFPTLFSSHTTDIAGDVPEHDGSTNKTVSQLNRFLYIVSLS